MITRISLCLIAAANLSITLIGDLTTAQLALSIGISGVLFIEGIITMTRSNP